MRGGLARQTSRWQAGLGAHSFTCKFPRAGRVGDVGCASTSLRRCALTLRMMLTYPCLRAGTPAVSTRARCWVRWFAPAPLPSDGCASGAGGAQEAGLGAPPGVVRFNLD